MPPPERDYTQTIELAPGSLPYPATKLIITQYLKVIERESERQFVWLIVGAFYNRVGRPIWSREVIISKVNPSDANSSASSTSSEASEIQQRFDSEPPVQPFAHTAVLPSYHEGSWPYYSYNLHQPYRPDRSYQTYIPQQPTIPENHPGSWYTSFDPLQRRWVNNWRPEL
ncbi:hypothetical protein NQ176_g9738 [Zarea fungicola]|uniref:Uncharacterized protein n=1 Tax=Zarea fungicola TaxID=93591 RepID=A0ACC1MK24_9HYPO|nr:hypothetical protein NQ176_g9738 [Lecanicillium fungicola]